MCGSCVYRIADSRQNVSVKFCSLCHIQARGQRQSDSSSPIMLKSNDGFVFRQSPSRSYPMIAPKSDRVRESRHNSSFDDAYYSEESDSFSQFGADDGQQLTQYQPQRQMYSQYFSEHDSGRYSIADGVKVDLSNQEQGSIKLTVTCRRHEPEQNNTVDTIYFPHRKERKESIETISSRLSVAATIDESDEVEVMKSQKDKAFIKNSIYVNENGEDFDDTMSLARAPMLELMETDSRSSSDSSLFCTPPNQTKTAPWSGVPESDDYSLTVYQNDRRSSELLSSHSALSSSQEGITHIAESIAEQKELLSCMIGELQRIHQRSP